MNEIWPYKWDWSGACAPDNPSNYAGQITFSVGLFQWLLKSNGKGYKKSSVRYRIKGFCNNPDDTYHKAQEMCDEYNRKRIGYEEPNNA